MSEAVNSRPVTQEPGLSPRPVRVRKVLDKVALEQIVLCELCFPAARIIPPKLLIHSLVTNTV
jgi:hypothetical protein